MPSEIKFIFTSVMSLCTAQSLINCTVSELRLYLCS